jgi:GNAT superfamily N-acetyltransferase
MQLRPLTREDRRLYEHIYTEPRMWTELGGVLDQDMAAKLERDVASVEADRHWVLVIVTNDGTAAGTVSLWDHEWEGKTIDEIGWMVLPEHQGRGLASAGVAQALRRVAFPHGQKTGPPSEAAGARRRLCGRWNAPRAGAGRAPWRAVLCRLRCSWRGILLHACVRSAVRHRHVPVH